MSRVKIGMVASVGIGDAAVYLIVAENLALNGFEITFYSNPISQLDAWLPNIKCKPVPSPENSEEEFKQFDLLVGDNISVIGKPHYKPEQFPELAKKYLYLGVGKVEKEFIFDHSKRLAEVLDSGSYKKIELLAKSAGEIRFQNGDRDKTMVDNAYEFCKNQLKLENCVRGSGFIPPENLNLQKQKYQKRVLLHPFSSNLDKNWPLKNYFKLARMLRKQGWEVFFTGSPKEREEMFLPMSNGEFELPVFNTLSDFAAFVYESRVLIGNDSGSVNLASALGIPTVTISRKGKKHRWRPDWTKGEVVAPCFRIKVPGSKTRIWKPFVTAGRILKSLDKVLAD